MQSIEVVLAMLLAVLASSYLVRVLPVSVPLPLVQIALGAAISGFNHGVSLDPNVFFLLFLPPLLFLDGWRIPKQGLFRDRAVILELALGLVVFTVLGAGFLIHLMIPAMPLPVAFALAAVISPTDPVAVTSIAARVPIPKRMMHILEGESLLNDASGLVCFRFAVAAAVSGGFSLTSASETFLWVSVAGVAVGVAFTWGTALAQRWITRHFGEDSGSPILVSLLIPFGAYLISEHLGASGILSAVAAGITMSYVELSGKALAATRVQRAAVWETVQFALNGVMFVLLGEQLPGILRGAVASVEQSGHLSPWWLVAYALAINIGLAVLRYAWVWTSLRLTLFAAQKRGEARTPPDSRLVAAMSLAGVRGAITLAGVLTLPYELDDGSAFPARDLAIFLATAVILLSLITASIGLPRLLRNLVAPQEPTEHLETDLARQEAAKAAVEAVRSASRRLPTDDPTDVELTTAAAVRVLSLYQNRLDSSGGTGVDAEMLRKADNAERRLRLAALEAERNTLFRLARENRISEEISRKLVRELDLLEARFR